MSGVEFLSSLPKSPNGDFAYSNPMGTLYIDKSFSTEGKFTVLADTIFLESGAIIDADRIDLVVKSHFIGLNATHQQFKYRCGFSIDSGCGLFEWGPLTQAAQKIFQEKFGHSLV